MTSWIEINPNWLEYVESRVDALVSENTKLKTEIANLRKQLQDAYSSREIRVEGHVPCVLVPAMPMPEMMQ